MYESNELVFTKNCTKLGKTFVLYQLHVYYSNSVQIHWLKELLSLTTLIDKAWFEVLIRRIWIYMCLDVAANIKMWRQLVGMTNMSNKGGLS